MADHLDLRTAKPQSTVSLTSVSTPPWSPFWAKVARPYAFFVLMLVAAVTLVPFLALLIDALRAQDDAVRSTVNAQIIDWAKTVLAPVAGFGSAVIGYYFGTRNGASDATQDPPPPAA